MSTSTWKNPVVGVHRMPFGTVAARVSGLPSHSGAWIEQLRAERADAVVVVRDHHEPQALARVGVERLELADVIEHADEVAVDVGAVVVEHALLPLAEVRRADPDREVEAGVDEALRARADERVLARPRAEALAEQQHLRAPAGRALREAVAQRGRRASACARGPRFTRSSDSGDGRAEYCIAIVAQSPRVRNSRIDTAA